MNPGHRPVPTGRIDRDGYRLTLHLSRRFDAPIEDVWAAITEPERLARWLATWRGDPASGSVTFRMLFEEGAPEEEVEIRECDPPTRLAVTSRVGEYRWYLDVALSETDGVTTLDFSQPDLDHDDSLSVGPGWEYYLDRLVAVETGGDLSEIDFERDYYPAMSDYYREQRDGRQSSPPS
jgi:uncharacterized protein YndB with AHSA1/START domain